MELSESVQSNKKIRPVAKQSIISAMTAATENEGVDEKENGSFKAVKVFIMLQCAGRYQKYWMQIRGSQLVFYTESP